MRNLATRIVSKPPVSLDLGNWSTIAMISRSRAVRAQKYGSNLALKTCRGRFSSSRSSELCLCILGSWSHEYV